MVLGTRGHAGSAERCEGIRIMGTRGNWPKTVLIHRGDVSPEETMASRGKLRADGLEIVHEFHVWEASSKSWIRCEVWTDSSMAPAGMGWVDDLTHPCSHVRPATTHPILTTDCSGNRWYLYDDEAVRLGYNRFERIG